MTRTVLAFESPISMLLFFLLTSYTQAFGMTSEQVSEASGLIDERKALIMEIQILSSNIKPINIHVYSDKSIEVLDTDAVRIDPTGWTFQVPYSVSKSIADECKARLAKVNEDLQQLGVQP